MEHLFIVDTNLFFECRRLDDLPWIELNADPVVIALVKPVIGEIDKHKKSGGRTRKRALEISGRIRRLLNSGQSEAVICDAHPRVLLRLMPVVRPAEDHSQDLDYTQNDDRIVGIASALSDDERYASVTMLTHDGVAASTAQSLDVPFRLIPDTWLRPPEETTEAKRIRELEKVLATYRSQEPRIELHTHTDRTQTNVVRRTAEELSREQIDRLIQALQVRHPVRTNFDVPASQVLADGTEVSYEAPGSEAIETYTGTTYPDWLAKCRSILEALHEERTQHEPVVRLQFGMSNTGTRPASKLRVSIEALGDLRLLRPPQTSDDDSSDGDPTAHTSSSALPRLPSPPDAPQFQRIVRQVTPRPGALDDEITRLAAGHDLAQVTAAGLAAQTLASTRPYLRAVEAGSAMEAMVEVMRARRTLDPLNLSSRHDDLATSHLIGRRFELPPMPPMPPPSLPQARDPEAFYYDQWPAGLPVKRGSLTCDLFRHRREEEVFEVEISFPPDGDVSGAVNCVAHAENLTEPVTLRFAVSRTIEARALLEAAEEMVACCK